MTGKNRMFASCMRDFVSVKIVWISQPYALSFHMIYVGATCAVF